MHNGLIFECNPLRPLILASNATRTHSKTTKSYFGGTFYCTTWIICLIGLSLLPLWRSLKILSSYSSVSSSMSFRFLAISKIRMQTLCDLNPPIEPKFNYLPCFPLGNSSPRIYVTLSLSDPPSSPLPSIPLFNARMFHERGFWNKTAIHRNLCGSNLALISFAAEQIYILYTISSHNTYQLLSSEFVRVVALSPIKDASCGQIPLQLQLKSSHWAC